MNLLFWLCWWIVLSNGQNSPLRVERATLAVGSQTIVCLPEQMVNLPAVPANVRIHAVALELELIANEQDWAALQNTRKLPIMFKWFRFSGARMFITHVSQDMNAVGSATGASRTMGNIVIHHARASNERITSGTWVVAPVYADNTPILINGRELVYQFRVP
ncbi:MAG: hypothetical protein RMJ87_13655 [Cytophagales bacterium]|nr:hypothetical protein [Bernardetiaceae bacterium]MDW8206068.1 hypothetical protein [Cytophagales bacterium]